MANALQQYLQRHIETEAANLPDWFSTNQFEYCLVIPACAEDMTFIDRFESQFGDKSYLLIVIINEPDNATVETHQQNAALLTSMQTRYSQQQSLAPLYLFGKDNQTSQLLVIDRTAHNSIPAAQGVGLARKIGCDIACRLITQQVIRDPWIYSSDADASLPDNYFEQTDVPCAARVFDFYHDVKDPQIDETLRSATILYEQHLRYYHAGLEWAGSPYAFYTLGSTLAVHYEYYARVRGFPKRNGGEDFYLLNKLAKTGEVLFIPECRIKLEARVSDRVPFGTGPAVASIMALNNPQTDYCSYHPQVFAELKTLLKQLESFFNEEKPVNLSIELDNALEIIRFDEGLTHSRKQAKNTEQFLKHMHDWLDGFKTLKLIHTLRDNSYPDQPLPQSLNNCPFQYKISPIPPQ